MRKNLRFYLALLCAKGTAAGLRLLGRKATNMPGSCAIRLCPDFLGRMPRPTRVIGVTGTNGKTSTSNMVEDMLASCGYDFICNGNGSNVDTGVAAALINNSTLLGKPKKDLAVFELDERSAPRILPYLRPDILLITNIFRDSYKRNAHVEFILDILNRYIPDSTRLILNADDLLCAGIRPENPRVYFGIDRQPDDGDTCRNIVQDVRVCPQCGGKLTWDFVRYHHIGRAHCPACGFASPAPKYRVISTDPARRTMRVELAGVERELPLPNSSTINVYNSLAAVALLSEFGLPAEKLAAAMDKLAVSETRFNEEKVNGRSLVMHLAKGQNPIACSRAFENARDYPGKKAVLLFLDDFYDATHSVESTPWLYDTDFEFLNDENIASITVAGARHWDVFLRLLMAGVPREKIAHSGDTGRAVELTPTQGVDTVFILYDVFNIRFANGVRDQIRERLKALPPKEETAHED